MWEERLRASPGRLIPNILSLTTPRNLETSTVTEAVFVVAPSPVSKVIRDGFSNCAPSTWPKTMRTIKMFDAVLSIERHSPFIEETRTTMMLLESKKRTKLSLAEKESVSGKESDLFDRSIE
jgi:hypothetical protein